MIKEYILNLYILYLDAIFLSNDAEKKKVLWKKIKAKKNILEYASNIENNSFKSNIIVSKILQEKSLFNTDTYNKIIKIIYDNKKIAKEKTHPDSVNSLLLLTLTNENLKLTKEQKIFVILEGEDSPYTEKYYKNKGTETKTIHGAGITDIRYKILCNVSFTSQEKRNLVNMFYPDDEIKITILKELEYSIISDLKLTKINDNNDELYELDTSVLPDHTKSKLELCKYIKSIIPEKLIKSYLNNE